jgi:Holliday junction resolvase RusA-like endonuclease
MKSDPGFTFPPGTIIKQINPDILAAVAQAEPTKPIRFFVPGKAEPGGSKRAFVIGGRAIITDANKNAKSWKDRVASVAGDIYSGPLLAIPLSVEMVFIITRPKGHYRTGKNAHLLRDNAPQYPTSKPDALKLARSTEDALTGILWKDDSLTVDLTTRKRFGDKPGAWVTVDIASGEKP